MEKRTNVPKEMQEQRTPNAPANWPLGAQVTRNTIVNRVSKLPRPTVRRKAPPFLSAFRRPLLRAIKIRIKGRISALMLLLTIVSSSNGVKTALIGEFKPIL